MYVCVFVLFLRGGRCFGILGGSLTFTEGVLFFLWEADFRFIYLHFPRGKSFYFSGYFFL